MILTLLYMATYECPKCKMSANITCGKCEAPLNDSLLKLDSGQSVKICECPNGHGKIKSPLCCGNDMICSVA